MTLSRRVKKIEGLQRSLIHEAPTVIRLIYEPSKTGPKEVGVIAGHMKLIENDPDLVF
ncbi:hypothetical protein LY10_03822 [Planktotalea frisia]|jgi:hypothetical protein|uniref:Uncharacterized protein n=1 Tax=Planktotalea frisia TaxID=696762 RepID=A0A1L9P235_9RHOB|nr:hypothetical protein PFRI_01770 [Planktotalea frisia]PZX20841.1 hypothetical protein LY10_03822 [Planktotalea frisia]